MNSATPITSSKKCRNRQFSDALRGSEGQESGHSLIQVSAQRTRTGHHSRVRTVLDRWLREPLVHFLLIGSLLFVIYGAWGHSSQLGSNRIDLTPDDVRQLQIGFAAQWERQPTPEELAGLVENRVREEILYREALAMGLDKDDDIVKRRMAQKMQFLAEDVANAHEPTTVRTESLVRKERDKFALPGRIASVTFTFRPIDAGNGLTTMR